MSSNGASPISNVIMLSSPIRYSRPIIKARLQQRTLVADKDSAFAVTDRAVNLFIGAKKRIQRDAARTSADLCQGKKLSTYGSWQNLSYAEKLNTRKLELNDIYEVSAFLKMILISRELQ